MRLRRYVLLERGKLLYVCDQRSHRYRAIGIGAIYGGSSLFENLECTFCKVDQEMAEFTDDPHEREVA